MWPCAVHRRIEHGPQPSAGGGSEPGERQPHAFNGLCKTELLQVLSSGSGSNVHADFYVIATGNPSRFHGRLELPMSLQTRFTTVLLQPIQPDELMLIIKDKAPFMPDDEARRWCSAFFEAKRATPTLTTRALWEALKATAGCSDGASGIR